MALPEDKIAYVFCFKLDWRDALALGFLPYVSSSLEESEDELLDSDELLESICIAADPLFLPAVAAFAVA